MTLQFNEVENLEGLIELLNYDDRELPDWHGQVGSCRLIGTALVITSSWANPRAGTNEERLQIEVKPIAKRERMRIVFSGYDEMGRNIKLNGPDWLTLAEVVRRMLKAVEAGEKRPTLLMKAIRGERFDCQGYRVTDCYF